MTGGIEAVGSMVEGGLLARAVEPKAGEAASGHTHQGACLNCGAALVGSHCSNCGQAGHVHRTLGAFFHDFRHGVLHFDGKIWRTLPLLAWRPGTLTREYIDGRRASYVSPIALFLFVTFLMFAVFHAVGNPIHFGDVTVDGQKTSAVQAETQLKGRIAALEKQRPAAAAAGQPVAKIDNDLQGLRRALATTDAIRTNDWKGLARQVAPGQTFTPASPVHNAVDAAWRKAKANPDLLVYELQSNAYKYSWLLIVISVPFVWLLFAWRRRYNLYDHTVFVTYSLSFMMLALTAASVGAAFGITLLMMVPILYAPFHMYRQLRGTYALGRGGALVRTAMLLVFAAVALALWTLALIALVLG